MLKATAKCTAAKVTVLASVVFLRIRDMGALSGREPALSNRFSRSRGLSASIGL
jgi:hypothetical protein